MQHFRPVAIVLTLAWALWFGGVITLFIAVTSLFHTFAPDRALAGTAAAGVFRRFEAYQLALAAIAVVAALAWRVREGHGARFKTLLPVLLSLACLLAVLSTFAVSRRIERLRRDRLADTAEFRRLHGASMGIYTLEAAALLGAGLVIPSALGPPASPRP